MINANFVLDAYNVIVSVVAIWIISVLVLRTEEQVDKSFKLLLASMVVVFIASVMRFDRYFGLFDKSQSEFFLIISRSLSVTFLTASAFVFLRAIERSRRKGK